MSQRGSRANSVESQPESVLTEIVNLTEEAVKIAETQQSANPPSPLENEDPTPSIPVQPRPRKRKNAVDLNDGGDQRPKRKATRIATFTDAPSVDNTGPDGLSDPANGADVKKLTEQLSSQKILITTLTKANNFLGDRFRRLERTVESCQHAIDNLSTALFKQEAESDITIRALEAHCKRMDRDLQRMMTDQKDTIAAQTQAIASQYSTITALVQIANIDVLPRDSA